jgi:predicted nucleic acid-binding protein
VRGLLDTSVFIAREQARPLADLPEEAAISVVTLAELHLGVLLAGDDRARAQRLRTLALVERTFDPIPIDADVARRFADLVADARRYGRRPKILDAFIAATALVNDVPVFTQDEDFDQFPGVRVSRV